MNPAMPARTAGFSLLVVMILLVVMSLLGIAILRSSAMQERMGANLRDRSLAMQAAEAAFASARTALATAPDVSKPTETWDTLIPTAAQCTSLGICPAGSSAPATWQVGPTLGGSDPAIPDTPSEYWIEYLGTGPADLGKCNMVKGGSPPLDCFRPIFRITTRSAAAGRANVTLQGNILNKLAPL